MKEKQKRITIEDLTKGNIWTLNEAELNQIIIEGKKNDDYAENEVHYMNIIRPVFDIIYLDREDEKRVAELESLHYEVFSAPSDGPNNAMAIRKRPLKKVTDLTLENIHHITASEVLELIEGNLGTGWKGLPLAIQDIIEQAFYVDCSTLPEYAMHRKGGIVERRKNDGYDVLELARGNWIEGIFIKAKPKMEKPRLDTSFLADNNKENDSEDDDNEDNDEDVIDDNEDEDEDNDEEVNDNPKFEEIDQIDVVDEEEEE